MQVLSSELESGVIDMPGVKEVCAAAALALMFPAAAESQMAAPTVWWTYADMADLALSAPIAAHVRLVKATPLKPGSTGPVAPGHSRFYMESDVVSLIRGAQGLPARVTYLADLPLRANGKPAKLPKKSEFLILAHPVAGRPDELRLAAPDAQLPYSQTRADQIRAILREALAPEAPPAITGIGKAFHVRGSLPGESETQIFLQTAEGRPVSLNVLRRPGEVPRWAVALSEIVDDAAAPPPPNSLLWYRLACTLPRALPAQSFADSDPAEIGAIQGDYRLVLERLGSCSRTRR